MIADPRETSRQQVERWWQIVHTRNQIFMKLATANPDDIQRLHNIDEYLAHLQQEYEMLERSRYPAGAKRIRKALLAAMVNIMACLQHARHGNDHERDVLFEIASVDVKMMETYLLEQELKM